MKFAYILLGIVLLGLGWWVQQPIQVWVLLWPVHVPNMLAPLGFPLLLGGGVSITYGLLANRKRSSKKR